MKNENPFQEKLYNHTMPVREAVWENIESRLPARKDQKKFPFFWFSLFTALVLGGAVFVFATQFNASTTPAKEIQQQNNLPENAQVQEELSANSNINSTSSTLQSSSIHTAIDDETEHEALANNENQDVSTIKGNNVVGKNNNTSNTKNLPSNQNNIQLSRNTTPTLAQGLESSNQVPHGAAHTSMMAGTASRAESMYNLLPITISFLKDASELHHVQRMFRIKADPSCYKFTGKEGRSNLTFDLFGGPGFSPRSFENISQESVLYGDARNATERGQYSFSLGARVNLNLSHEWAVRLGVMYDQTGDIFDYTDTLATQRSTRIDSFFAADGTFLYAETNTVLILGTLIKKIHNRYHHLDIPLLASYEMPMGRAILMVNAGPVINLMTSVRGQILDAGLVPQHITEGEPNQLNAYKTNVGLSVYLGAGALFPISKNISGLIEPRLLYRIKPVTLSTYQLKEHRHFAGLNLGIRYHLN